MIWTKSKRTATFFRESVPDLSKSQENVCISLDHPRCSLLQDPQLFDLRKQEFGARETRCYTMSLAREYNRIEEKATG